MRRIFIFLIAMAAPAQAEVYRCQAAGQVIFSDEPCAPNAKPETLPPVTVVKPGSFEEALESAPGAKSEARTKKDKADAEWLRQHEARKEKEARIRKGRVEGRVVEGMTAAQVRNLLGDPDRIQREQSGGLTKETWIYRTSDGTQTIALRNGEVHSVKQNRQKKNPK